MHREEIDLAIEWAAAEGWNPGIHDRDCFYSADPGGFLVGLLDDEPIATLSAVKYGENFGFLGFYIVKPEYRGKGYGIQIWNAGLKYLEGRNIGLDGVVAQQNNYRKSGFELAYRNIRHAGLSGGGIAKYPGLVPLSTLPFEIIDAYDRAFFPATRTKFIKSWINQPGIHAMGIMQQGKLAGYGVIRECYSGYKVGPLFADSPELAEILFQSLRSGIEATQPIYLDTPEVNASAVALAKRYDMQIVFETARMYTTENPALPLDRLYGVTSFELG